MENKKHKFKLEDSIKMPESTIDLFKEVTSEKKILREIIQESKTFICDCPLNDGYPSGYVGCICDYYTYY